MMSKSAVIVAAGLLAITASAADAACTRLAFSVNDYGKEGPTRDAKALLDKYIAQWTAERGIKKYRVGKKDVTCELFLDFIVFDEHTCRAEASVCWDGPQSAPERAEKSERRVLPKAGEGKATPAKKSE
jgi:hypothetical protein